MKPKTFMLIAGEASGDLLAAELVAAIQRELSEAKLVLTNDYQPLETSLAPRFFGAGGPYMAEAGVQLAFDMTRYAAIGPTDAAKMFFKLRPIFQRLYKLAIEQEPDAIICVDFAGFNRHLAGAIKAYCLRRQGWFQSWNPKIIQYVSPQVWASRPRRAFQMARDYDLLLSLFPFEKEWYAKRVPKFRVEFIGHPIIDRYGLQVTQTSPPLPSRFNQLPSPGLVLLPGSRTGELRRHVPVMLATLEILRREVPAVRAVMVVPSEERVKQAKELAGLASIEIRSSGLAETLRGADVAICKTGTISLECALFGVPTVAMYKTSWFTYQLGKRLVKVTSLVMPNLLAKEAVFPEFIQGEATPTNIARTALELLRDQARRAAVKAKLAQITASLGGPGASSRAAQAILRLLDSR